LPARVRGSCCVRANVSWWIEWPFEELLTHAIVVKISRIRQQSQRSPDDERDESKTILQQIEAVNRSPDQRERLEERVVDPVHQHHVHVGEQDGRIQGCDPRRHQQGFHHHVFGTRFVLVGDFRPCADAFVASLFSQACSALVQDRCGACLGPEEE
jgi:hypothetical protein